MLWLAGQSARSLVPVEHTVVRRDFAEITHGG
jgi:hypothetical protein